jgi:hypothetical protein
MSQETASTTPSAPAVDRAALLFAACPFCGSARITIEWEPCDKLDSTDTNRRWFAECQECCSQGPFCQRETEVVSAWNGRANREPRRDVRAVYAGTSPYGQKLNIEVWLYPGQRLIVEDSATGANVPTHPPDGRK